MRADLGSSQNQTGIDICDSISAALCSFERFSKKNYGIGVLPLRIRRRKKCADIWRGHGSKQSVGDRMEEDVSVRVAAESFVVRETDSADLQGNAESGIRANRSRNRCEFEVPAAWSSALWVKIGEQTYFLR